MNISPSEQALQRYKSLPLLLSPMEHSTSSINGYLSNVSFDEQELTKILQATGNIMKIDSNYGHVVNEMYVAEKKVRSNRGRRAKEKVRKPRKYQGDGSSFNSQISFSVMGSCVCRKSNIGESRKKANIFDIGNGDELITKIYKIKVFRNGSITVPGILDEDMIDIQAPLHELADYLSIALSEPIELIHTYPIMKNYKTILKAGTINMRELQDYCSKHFHDLLNTRGEDILAFLCCPAFKTGTVTPIFDSWHEWIDDLTKSKSQPNVSNTSISELEFERYLRNSTHIKNIYVDFEHMQCGIIKILAKYKPYEKLHILYSALERDSRPALSEILCRKIVRHMIKKSIDTLLEDLRSTKENLLSHIKYDPEKYQGFIIKVKTPHSTSPDKKTTVKIFPSGKIDIDGSTTREEADYIYYWFNSILVDNPRIIFYKNDVDYEYDSEFSSDSEDD